VFAESMAEIAFPCSPFFDSRSLEITEENDIRDLIAAR
jgi:hypothetical protein